MIVYLAGAIDRIPFDEAKAWRNKASVLFKRRNIKTINPFHLSEVDSPANEMVHNDLTMIFRSDVLLVNLTHKCQYVGSLCEMVEARIKNIPVVVFGDQLDCKWANHYITKRLNTLEEAVEYIAMTYVI